ALRGPVRGRARPGADRLVVGEDVVEVLGAPARPELADVGTLPVRALEVVLRRGVARPRRPLLLDGGLVLDVLLVVVGHAEVDERAVPDVAESHLTSPRAVDHA